MNKNKKGFTLTELIVVIVIIAILAAVLIPTLTGTVNKSRKSAAQQEAASVNTTYQAWLIDTTEDGGYDAETMTTALDRLASFIMYYAKAQDATIAKNATIASVTKITSIAASGLIPAHYEYDGLGIISVDPTTSQMIIQATNKYYVKVVKSGETVYTVDADYANVIG